jgi:hypothetical protein
MRQAQQRQKVFAELQGDTVKVSERLDNIIQLQAINVSSIKGSLAKLRFHSARIFSTT